ncbi:hypothetical protein, partial [Salmonella sp. s57379]|uniref:hypothetical protein n=1 Tax=Salmonella sp. s57379 TaxID=3159694 RepID=UPI0039809410
ESIWNHENYWVNMQDCRSGCTGMTFDLRDDLTWEYMLCGPSSSSSVARPDIEDEEQDEQDDEDTEEHDLFKMPWSWVTQIQISEEDTET